MSEKSRKDRILRVIDEMSLKPSEVELLEDCEMVTNLVIGQVLEMMGSKEMREDVLWLQAQHVKPNKKRWRNIVELTEELWEKAGGGAGSRHITASRPRAGRYQTMKYCPSLTQRSGRP